MGELYYPAFVAVAAVWYVGMAWAMRRTRLRALLENFSLSGEIDDADAALLWLFSPVVVPVVAVLAVVVMIGAWCEAILGLAASQLERLGGLLKPAPRG